MTANTDRLCIGNSNIQWPTNYSNDYFIYGSGALKIVMSSNWTPIQYTYAWYLRFRRNITMTS